MELSPNRCPQHLQGLNVEEVKSSLKETSLKTGAVCTRFTEDFVNGAFTNPENAKRKAAIELVLDAGEWACHLDADELVV